MSGECQEMSDENDDSMNLPPLSLSPDEARAVRRVGQGLVDVAGGHVDSADFVAAARSAWEELPANLRRAAREFRRHSRASGILLIKNVPVDERSLAPTPCIEGSVQRLATVPAALLVMLACGLGDPGAFRAEKSGALVQDVVPVPGREDFQGNTGSVLLKFHTENAFHPHRPDYVALLCLRAGEGVGLRTGCVRVILPMLSPQARKVLFTSEFTTQPPPSFGGGGTMSPPHSVLSGDLDDPDIRVDLAATEALTVHAEAALAELRRLLDEAAQTHFLRSGDLVVVDNRVTVHGRTAFRPRYDGSDRWLQRTFSFADFRRSRVYRPDDGYVIADGSGG